MPGAGWDALPLSLSRLELVIFCHHGSVYDDRDTQGCPGSRGALQSQEAVTSYLKSKQLLALGFARQPGFDTRPWSARSGPPGRHIPYVQHGKTSTQLFALSSLHPSLATLHSYASFCSQHLLYKLSLHWLCVCVPLAASCFPLALAPATTSLCEHIG